MRIAVLGGLGFQGKAAVIDLAKSDLVDEVICADTSFAAWEEITPFLDKGKVQKVKLDASSKAAIISLIERDVDAVVDLLPVSFMVNAFEAAIEAGVPLVSTNYGAPIRHLDEAAKSAGITLMPECGLDPGIDLVICGHAVGQFDELNVLNSYCGGIPEKEACNNPLNYKVSWNWDMVLRCQKRESVFIKNGYQITVSAADQHNNKMIHQISFSGLGELEAVPNGDAVFYSDLVGVTDTIQHAGRYALRWPGWCAFWAPLKKFGFLSNKPIDGFDDKMSPHQFLVKLMGPQLQYLDGEKDVVVMRNVFEGVKEGRKKSIVTNLIIKRDLETGLFAMGMGVGYPASIVAQMIANGQISAKGVLNPAVDVPYSPFMAELSKRGINIQEEVVISE